MLGAVAADDPDPGMLFDRLPVGWSRVRVAGRRYAVTRALRGGGRSESVYAEELGGGDVISANLYGTAAGAALRPCEMPAEKVLSFLADLVPDDDDPRP